MARPGADVDLFLKRVERLEAQLEALKTQIKQDEEKGASGRTKGPGPRKTHNRHNAKPGKLICDGKSIQHEIIYWKDVPGDMQNLRHAHHAITTKNI